MVISRSQEPPAATLHRLSRDLMALWADTVVQSPMHSMATSSKATSFFMFPTSFVNKNQNNLFYHAIFEKARHNQPKGEIFRPFRWKKAEQAKIKGSSQCCLR
jgi:hypothetical protein